MSNINGQGQDGDEQIQIVNQQTSINNPNISGNLHGANGDDGQSDWSTCFDTEYSLDIRSEDDKEGEVTNPSNNPRNANEQIGHSSFSSSDSTLENNSLNTSNDQSSILSYTFGGMMIYYYIEERQFPINCPCLFR